MDLHKQTGEMLNMDVMIATLGIKKLQTINEKIRNQLKQEKLANRTKQMRVEELEQWVMDLGENPQDATSVQALMKTKDTKIQALKKRLNIPGIEHVQTPELQAIQKEKDQLLKQMVQMGDQMEMYEKHIEILKKGPSSSQMTESTDPTEGLAKALSELNLKGVEIEKLNKSISTQNEEIKVFKEQLKDKDKIIEEYHKLKAKMLTDIEQLQNKLSGKPYLIGARHLIWDEIIMRLEKYGITSK
jgi:chromosome segregation ATPase